MNEVKIGNQIWMAENLNVEEFRNGDPIPHAQTLEEWKRLNKEGKPAWTYYDNDPKYGAIYGKLYNWNAVEDPRGLAPKGWHIPDHKEWEKLSEYLGDDDLVGTKLKSASGWEDNGNGTDEVGFSGLPGGYYYFNGKMDTIGSSAIWWSSTKKFSATMWVYSLYKDNGQLSVFDDDYRNGFAVRCLKGESKQDRVEWASNVRTSKDTSLLGLLFPMLFGSGNS